MRFRGGGVGHKVTHDWDSILEDDCDEKMSEAQDEDGVDGEGDSHESMAEASDSEEWEDDEETEWKSLMVGRNGGSDSDDDTDESEQEDTLGEHDNDGQEMEEDLYGNYGYGAL